MLLYDRVVARNALVLFCLYAGAAWLVLRLTDEAVSTQAMRLARVAAMAPAFSVLTVLVLDSLGRGRGEATALAALGVSPPRRLLGAIGVSWLAGAAACALLLLPVSDVRSLFPVIIDSESWQIRPADFRLPGAGVTVGPDAWPAFEHSPSAREVLFRSGPSRGAAVAMVLPLSIVAPVWASLPVPVVSRWFVAGVTAAVSIFVLHAIAAGRLPTSAALGVAVPFLVHAAITWQRVP